MYPRSERAEASPLRWLTDSCGTDDSGRAETLTLRANYLALLTRHAANALAAAVGLLDPSSAATLAGRVILVALGLWAVYRLITRSLRPIFTAVDCLFVVAVCAATPLLTPYAELLRTSTAQTAVVSGTVIGFAVSMPARASVPMNALILTAYAWGAASVVGWQNSAESPVLRYLTLAAIMGLILRATVLRVEAAAKRAHESFVLAGEMRERVTSAARDYRQEQFALLHDTVASTLLLVADGTSVPRDKLSAQARTALEVLDGQRLNDVRSLNELVSAVRDIADGSCTPVRFSGSPELWLDGEVCAAVEAATREVLNNVDRHARASVVSIHICDHRLEITDDGRGFNAEQTMGNGIARSVIARMNRVGGAATIDSACGRGTTVRLSWPTTLHTTGSPAASTEAEGLVKRIRRQYGFALVGWGLIVAALSVPSDSDALTGSQVLLAALAVAGCLLAIPTLVGRSRHARWLGIAVLIGISVIQPALLPASQVGSTAQWSLWVVGWCLSPLLLGLRLRMALPILGTYFVTACAMTMARNPSAGTVAELGFLAASVGVLLVAAQIADAMFADAVADTHARTQAHLEMLAKQAAATQAFREFRLRISDVRHRVVPLLLELSRGAPLDPPLRRRARVESQRIRGLLSQQSAREHALLSALRPALDQATHRDVDVAVDVQSGLPTIGTAEVARLAHRISQILDDCTNTVRVVIHSVGEELVVSVVCRRYVGALSDGDMSVDRLEVVKRNDTTWFTIRQPASPLPPDNPLDYDCAS